MRAIQVIYRSAVSKVIIGDEYSNEFNVQVSWKRKEYFCQCSPIYSKAEKNMDDQGWDAV